MEYTKKHKNLIAKLFRKAGILEESKAVLSCDEYKHEIANAMREAAQKTKTPIGANPALLDAVRRYENWHCAIYNLGGSHGQIGSAYSHLGKTVSDVPLRKRRELMLEMLGVKAKGNSRQK